MNCSENLVKMRRIPVKINARPKKSKEEKVVSILELKKYPNNAAGIVAISKNIHIILYSFLKVMSLIISFHVKIITAKREAKCKKTKNNMSGFCLNIIFASAKCPEEETGKNSVTACINARKISYSIIQIIVIMV